MLHRAFLRFVALLALAGIVVAASGCGSTLEDAATVGTTHISRTTLRDEVSDLVSTDAFTQALKDQFSFASHEQATDANLTAAWLSFLIRQVAVDQEFKARKLTVGPQDRSNAQSALDQQFTDQQGRSILSKFPKRFRDRMLARFTRLVALQRALEGKVPEPTLADARQYYEQNKDQLFPCPSAKQVAHIVVATEAAAADALAQVQSGTDFATVAKNVSTDAATKDDGGLVADSQAPRGCYVEGTDAALDAAVKAAPVNQPTGPVKSNAGYEVILVNPYTPPAFEQVQTAVLQFLQRQAQQNAPSANAAAFNAALSKRLTAEKVHVDPRYGTWVVDSQGAQVVPPKAPSVRETRTTTSTIAPNLNQLGGSTPTTSAAGQ
jgi:foldase protein PrsA